MPKASSATLAGKHQAPQAPIGSPWISTGQPNSCPSNLLLLMPLDSLGNIGPLTKGLILYNITSSFHHHTHLANIIAMVPPVDSKRGSGIFQPGFKGSYIALTCFPLPNPSLLLADFTLSQSYEPESVFLPHHVIPHQTGIIRKCH